MANEIVPLTSVQALPRPGGYRLERFTEADFSAGDLEVWVAPSVFRGFLIGRLRFNLTYPSNRTLQLLMRNLGAINSSFGLAAPILNDPAPQTRNNSGFVFNGGNGSTQLEYYRSPQAGTVLAAEVVIYTVVNERSSLEDARLRLESSSNTNPTDGTVDWYYSATELPTLPDIPDND